MAGNRRTNAITTRFLLCAQSGHQHLVTERTNTIYRKFRVWKLAWIPLLIITNSSYKIWCRILPRGKFQLKSWIYSWNDWSLEHENLLLYALCKVSGLLIIFYLTYCVLLQKKPFHHKQMVLDRWIVYLNSLLFLWKVVLLATQKIHFKM
jgi:hypothetical protein